jgi:hypothetical protein
LIVTDPTFTLVLTTEVEVLGVPDVGVNLHATVSVTEVLLFEFKNVLPLEVSVTVSVALPAAVADFDPVPSGVPECKIVQTIVPADGNVTVKETDPLEARPDAVRPETLLAPALAEAPAATPLWCVVVGGVGIE